MSPAEKKARLDALAAVASGAAPLPETASESAPAQPIQDWVREQLRKKPSYRPVPGSSQDGGTRG